MWQMTLLTRLLFTLPFQLSSFNFKLSIMYVIEVIPLARGIHSGTLSYYSSVAYPIGSLLSIPVRQKEIRALVTKVEHLSAAKTAVRAATFTLRRLPEQSNTSTVPSALVNTALALSRELPATLGSILYTLLPNEIREGKATFDPDESPAVSTDTPEVTVLTAPLGDRLDIYRRRIREAFAHRGSVMIVVPASAYLERLSESLSQGISERMVVFSPTFSAKKIARAYQELGDLSTSKLIITTPAHAFIDRHDIVEIIIDQSRSPHYRGRVRPYIDIREALKKLAVQTGRRLMLGDVLPSPEDEWKRRNEIYETEGESPRRLNFDSRFKVIKQKDKPTGETPFCLFSSELESAIEKTLAEKGRVFLYSARRGIAPVVACADCGSIFRCPDSGTPYSLFRTMENGEEKRWFLSSTSGRRVKAAETCPVCSSWRLRERGIGIQHIYDDLLQRYDVDRIVLFDHTTAKTPRRAAELVYDFYDKKGSILLGTAMTLPYLEEPVDLSAIVSADAARTVPTWRADEEFFALLLALREITTDTVMVQTRTDVDDILEYAKTGQIERFFNDELELCQALNYPPFSYFVHLTISGPSESLRPLEAELTGVLSDWSIVFYSAPESQRSQTVRYGLIKIPSASWPDVRLMDTLRTLPPNVRIEINPAKIV